MAFDGTGYGLDGTIWGGELLWGSYDAVERVGHLAPVLLPGGDAAIRRPARSALAHLAAAGVAWDRGLPPVDDADEVERRVVARMLQTGTGCTPTTSMGRLFDAVAALLGVRQDAAYEGQAAIELEAIAATAAPGPDDPAWRIPVVDDGGGLCSTRHPRSAPVRPRCAPASRRPRPPAPSTRRWPSPSRPPRRPPVRDHGADTVGLTGGVFQNALLTAACRRRLVEAGFTVLVHRLVPPNDGGLALGQVAVAASGGAVGAGPAGPRRATTAAGG